MPEGAGRHEVVFHDSGRKAANPPHRGYERGLVVDAGDSAPVACAVDIPWPAAGIGLWEVRCRTCGVSAALTAAGRIDDPRRIVLGCGRPPTAGGTTRRPWDDRDGPEGRP